MSITIFEFNFGKEENMKKRKWNTYQNLSWSMSGHIAKAAPETNPIKLRFAMFWKYLNSPFIAQQRMKKKYDELFWTVSQSTTFIWIN